jgi:hypothetical protein
MRKRSKMRASVVLTHLLMVFLSVLWVLPAAAQIPDNASGQSNDQLTRPFFRAAIAALADIHRWREMAMVDAQSGMLNANYGDVQRTAAYEDLRRAQFNTKTLGDEQAGDLLRQHFANVKSWVDDLVQARSDMAMDPAGLGQDPELMKIDDCEKGINAMLGNGAYTGIDACQ